MNPALPFTVRLCRWHEASARLRDVRHSVFIVEQRIPEALEWDGRDHDATHALAEDRDGGAIGCARLLADGHIGRVAVLAPWRRRGVGSALLRRLVDEATRRGDVRTIVNAQVAAMPFYARHRFAARDEWHEEAGIAHCVMERTSGR